MAKRNRKPAVKVSRSKRAKPVGDWADRFATFKAAVEARKPDGLKAVKTEIARLDSRLSSVVIRRELVARTEENVQRETEAEAVSKFASRLAALSLRRGQMPTRVDTRVANLQAEIDIIAGQVGDLRDLIRHLKAEPLQDDDGPTPEASLKPSARDPILTLYEAGHIGDDAVKASREIARVYEAIGRAGATRIGRMDGAGGGSGGEQELPDGIANIHHGRFLPWATRMRKQAPEKFDLVIDVAVFGAALDSSRRRAGLGWDKALAYLRDGLKAYWDDNESHRLVLHWPPKVNI